MHKDQHWNLGQAHPVHVLMPANLQPCKITMNEFLYTGMSVTISFGDESNNFTGGTAKIWYMKPDFSTGFWNALISYDNSTIYYKTAASDIDQVGPWSFQGIVEMDPTDIWKSEIKDKRFELPLNS